MNYIILLIGFLLLIKGADFFVSGSSSIAKRLHISELVIGLTIVAFGTSAPEASVSIISAFHGQNDISVGNILGSNIFNLLMVIGVCSFLKPMPVQKTIMEREFPYSVIAVVVLFILGLDTVLNGASAMTISRSDGLILLIFFGLFLYYLLHTAKSQNQSEPVAEQTQLMPMGNSVLFSIFGLAGVVFGGKLVVDSATDIALAFGISQSVIGLTIVAAGTSLPELVTSVVAAKKGENDMAMGNVIGSNIFNIFFILGISAAISPIEIGIFSIYDILVLIAVSAVAYFFAVTKRTINRWEGLGLVVMYFAYMVFIVIR